MQISSLYALLDIAIAEVPHGSNLGPLLFLVLSLANSVFALYDIFADNDEPASQNLNQMWYVHDMG